VDQAPSLGLDVALVPSLREPGIPAAPVGLTFHFSRPCFGGGPMYPEQARGEEGPQLTKGGEPAWWTPADRAKATPPSQRPGNGRSCSSEWVFRTDFSPLAFQRMSEGLAHRIGSCVLKSEYGKAELQLVSKAK
jgi:hypothetical protein